jgi:hypothetical protein
MMNKMTDTESGKYRFLKDVGLGINKSCIMEMGPLFMIKYIRVFFRREYGKIPCTPHASVLYMWVSVLRHRRLCGTICLETGFRTCNDHSRMFGHGDKRSQTIRTRLYRCYVVLTVYLPRRVISSLSRHAFLRILPKSMANLRNVSLHILLNLPCRIFDNYIVVKLSRMIGVDELLRMY